MTNKLAVFDFDSTLMDGETLEFFARTTGIEQKVKEITDRAMGGELDFFESLTYRVSLLKGLSVDMVNKICAQLPVMNGAKEVVAGLKDRGYKVVCFSGGFRNATKLFAQKLGLDSEFANILHSKDGVLTGEVGGEMMFNDSKGEMLIRLQKLLDVTPENTLAVGDGANDLSMFKYSNKRVAFCAKPVLKEHANIIINEKDLSKILDVL
ncbi:MAG: phosphoserine phosphatase SerB [Cyanobacteriota bacterium]|nr:phosphoserine phosphatase SerB [Cyanobacteriota bacterium]MDY6358837.1 phosphoserine phosphatase SerB [Cyanobacteriota bacterium]MDY6364212.1 phosphoserine phosphatase SerB [Cyanobacteriota bacterium]MDY6383663.1 phosphoserine phosphatase SerB [Cyanobacteriota bacterium]